MHRASLSVATLSAAVVGLALLAPAISAAKDPHKLPLAPVICTELATDPANGLLGNPAIKSVNSSIIAASGANAAYCQVNLLYGTSPEQNINIRVGLPLNSVDGGTGGVEGAWNGRTQGIGGGGCAGSLNVNAPVNAGYVGSGTDTGHVGRKLRARGESGRHLQSSVHPGFHPERDQASRCSSPSRSRARTTRRSPPTTIGTAARRVAARVIYSRRSSARSSTACSRTRRRSIGRDSRRRRCGVRSS